MKTPSALTVSHQAELRRPSGRKAPRLTPPKREQRRPQTKGVIRDRHQKGSTVEWQRPLPCAPQGVPKAKIVTAQTRNSPKQLLEVVTRKGRQLRPPRVALTSESERTNRLRNGVADRNHLHPVLVGLIRRPVAPPLTQADPAVVPKPYRVRRMQTPLRTGARGRVAQ